MTEIRNPKKNARHAAVIGIATPPRLSVDLGFGIWNLLRVSDFGFQVSKIRFRISDFTPDPSAP
jgi:hypothetical protein